MSNRAVAFVKEHPGGSAIGAVVLVILFLFLFKGGSGGSAGSAEAAYYNAVAQQTAAGNAVQLSKMQLDAQTTQETIAATYGLQAAQLKSADSRYAIDSNERITQHQTDTQHAIADNVVNLQNSQLHSNEIIAGINAHSKNKTSTSLVANAGSILTGLGNLTGGIGSFFGF